MEVGVVRRHGPARMWTMLLISLLLLVPLGVLSNMTHSLLLTLEVYHMLYNVLTLGGWLLSARLGAAPGSPTHTFGWARLEVLTTVVTLLFLTALCFSVSVEAIQSLANAADADDMHHPVYVMVSAAAVLLANLVCYILIGGYTSLQSTLLAPNETAKCLSPAASEAQLRPDSRLAFRPPAAPLVHHFVRDLGGALLLVVSAVTAHLCRAPAVRYLDPALALLVAGLLVATSSGLFSECCLILLQTMPAKFDAAAFRVSLLAAFPAVQDVHELHVWRLTPVCVVATAHVVLAGPQQFNDVAERVTAFFAAHAVGQVTLQPEFSGASNDCGKSRCLLPCSEDSCAKARCCCDEPVLHRVPTIRVTPPSQASLASRGSGSSGGGKVTSNGGQPQDQFRRTGVNGDCVKHAVESCRTGAVDGTGVGGAEGGGYDAGGGSVGSVTRPPAPAPRIYSTETSALTETVIEESAASQDASEPTLDRIAKSRAPSENAVKTMPPSEHVVDAPTSVGSVAEMSVPFASVSSIGDWHDAEG